MRRLSRQAKVRVVSVTVGFAPQSISIIVKCCEPSVVGSIFLNRTASGDWFADADPEVKTVRSMPKKDTLSVVKSRQ